MEKDKFVSLTNNLDQEIKDNLKVNSLIDVFLYEDGSSSSRVVSKVAKITRIETNYYQLSILSAYNYQIVLNDN